MRFFVKIFTALCLFASISAHAKFSRCEFLATNKTASAIYDVWEGEMNGSRSLALKGTADFMLKALGSSRRQSALALKKKLRAFLARGDKGKFSDFFSMSYQFTRIMSTERDSELDPSDKTEIDWANNAYPHLLEIPTERELTIRDFNDLSPYPIYPLGLVARETNADGRSYSSKQLFLHDRNHAQAMIQLRDVFVDQALVFERTRFYERTGVGSRKPFSREIRKRERLYQAFREFVERQENPIDKETLEIFWFDLFHEVGRTYSSRGIREWAESRDTREIRIRQLALRLRMPNDLGTQVRDPAKHSKDTLRRGLKLLAKFARSHSGRER